MITTLISYDGTAFGSDYEVGFVKASEPRLPPASVQTLQQVGAWPVIVALQRNPQKFALLIRIAGTNYQTLRTALFQLFDPEDEDPKTLVGENHDDIEMSIECLCEDLTIYGDQRRDTVFVATMVVDGDVRWRATTETSDTWSITASGQTNTINNDGEAEVYPVYTIKPTSGKTGEYDYRRWVPIKWRSENAGPQYPLRAELDTATIVTNGDMQADGDDLRVYSDGQEIDRWLDDMDSATTGIWFTLDFTRAPDLSLATAIADSGAVATIDVDDEEELALMPESGIVLIDDEAFLYTGRNLTDKQLTGVTREAKGTSAAAHTVGDTVHWIQHDVWILYGNGSASAPSVDDDYKPMFELDHSDNEQWVYESFGDGNNKRAGRWQGWLTIKITGASGRYTATEKTLADPYTVAGTWVGTGTTHLTNAGGWSLENPCGIVNAAWSNGKKRAAVVTDFLAQLRYWPRDKSWWDDQATLADPSTADTWEAWSEAAGSDWDPADALAIILYFFESDVEVSDVTVDLYADEVPVVSVNAEQGNYELGCTITNETTGEAISLDFRMDVDSELEIDTDERTVIWLEDGSRQLQARELSSARRQWLRLVQGNNTLRFNDTGTGNVTLTTEFARRYY